MMSIGCCSRPRNLAMNFSAALDSVVQCLQNKYTGCFANDEPVTIFVIWTACGFRLVVPLTQCLHRIETTNPGFTDYAFRSARQDNIGLAQSNQVISLHDRIR